MPEFNTGTPWDQGLNALGSYLFRDPDAIARAGYYGAMQRNQTLQGDETLRHRAGEGLFQNLFEGMHGPQVPSTPPPGQALDPTAGQAMGPMAGAPNPADQPTALNAPLPGPVLGAPLPKVPGAPIYPQPLARPRNPQDLVSLFSRPGAPPLDPAMRPGGGAAAGPAFDPATVAAITDPAVQERMGIHPATFTTADGIDKATGAAAHDGSPAQFDLAPFINAAVQANWDPDRTRLNLGAVINKAQSLGMLDEQHAKQAMLNLNSTEFGSTTRQAAITGEQRFEYLGQTVPIIRADGSVGATTKERFLKAPDEFNAIDSSAASALVTSNMGMIDVFDKLADGTPDVTRTRTMTRAEARSGKFMPVPPGYSPVGKDTANAELAGAQRGDLVDEKIADIYRPPAYTGPGFSRRDIGTVSPEKRAEILNLANRLFQENPNLRSDQKNFGQAIDLAIERMQKTKGLPSVADVLKMRERSFWDMSVIADDPQVVRDANDDKIKHFIIDKPISAPDAKLTPPGTPSGATLERSTGVAPVSNVFNTPNVSTRQVAPPTPLPVAPVKPQQPSLQQQGNQQQQSQAQRPQGGIPVNAADGIMFRSKSTGQLMTVHGRMAYPATPQETALWQSGPGRQQQ